MSKNRRYRSASVRILVAATLAMTACAEPEPGATGEDPLPSWVEGATRSAITDFVASVVEPTRAGYVEPAERIAVFDNDGTLWAEQPTYFQLLFALDRVRDMALEHPEWTETEPFRAILANDQEAISLLTLHDLVEVVMVTHAGMTVEEFSETVADWLASNRHPRFDRPFTDVVYAPMLELLDYLRANDFKTFIVSGGGLDFLRVFSEEIYGVPPEQVVGSSGVTVFEMRDEAAVLLKRPEIDFVDDKEGKPVAINRFIGRRPIAAFGNSDGDLAMLQYTAAGSGVRLMGLVHHDDADREWAYDRESSVGRLDAALDEAEARGWLVISMRDDWSQVFTFEPERQTP